MNFLVFVIFLFPRETTLFSFQYEHYVCYNWYVQLRHGAINIRRRLCHVRLLRLRQQLALGLLIYMVYREHINLRYR